MKPPQCHGGGCRAGLTGVGEGCEKKCYSGTSVALAYVMHESLYAFPICGGRTIEHLKDDIEALDLKLDDADMEEIHTGYAFHVGFPHNILSGGPNGVQGPGHNVISIILGRFDYVMGAKPSPRDGS